MLSVVVEEDDVVEVVVAVTGAAMILLLWLRLVVVVPFTITSNSSSCCCNDRYRYCCAWCVVFIIIVTGIDSAPHLRSFVIPVLVPRHLIFFITSGRKYGTDSSGGMDDVRNEKCHTVRSWQQNTKPVTKCLNIHHILV